MPALDINAIKKLLPHRYPMLLVDRVVDYEAGKWIHGLKNVSANEPFFQGHFPAYPVMPGVLVIEALAQLAGLLTILSGVAKADGSQLVLFAGIDEARFKRQVMPGDTLALQIDLERAVRGVGRFSARALVGGELVCEARLLAAVRNLPQDGEAAAE
ncbi:MAG: 3-hydroxyacyl-ACP dehydratase FabZ [Proteobacteria bacterium]|nr:3-hydroxyacyl-ACP dehydratase FabZ [Pseudomonadota bacterium]